MKAMRRMSRTSRTVIWRTTVQASANTARLPFARARGGRARAFAGRVRVPGAVGQDGLGRADGPGDRPDVVDPQDVGAALDGEDGGRDRPLEPFRRGPGEGPAEESPPRE